MRRRRCRRDRRLPRRVARRRRAGHRRRFLRLTAQVPATTAPTSSPSPGTGACARESPRATGRRSSAATTTAAGSTPTASTSPPSSSGCWNWWPPTSATSRRLPVPARFRHRGQRSHPPRTRIGTSRLRRLTACGRASRSPTAPAPCTRSTEGARAAPPRLLRGAGGGGAIRITDAEFRLVEAPVHMRQREHGESSFQASGRWSWWSRSASPCSRPSCCASATSIRQRRDVRRVLRAARPRLNRWRARRCRRAGRAVRADAPAATATARAGAPRSPASWSRCDPRAANAAQPCHGPAAAHATQPTPAAVSRLCVRGRAGSAVVSRGRAERAATT